MGADGTQAALADYFVRRYNLAGRDAAYSKDRVTLAAVPRNGERLKQGDGFYVTVRVADGWSDSPDFKSAMKYYTPGKTFRWFVGDPYPQYGRATFEGLMLARNNVGTLIDLKGTEVDGIANNMLDSLEFQLWNDGTGARGQISVLGGTAASRVFTLATSTDVYNFPVGAILMASTTATGAGTDRADLYKVTAISPQNAQVMADRISGAGNDVAANDYLFTIGSKDKYAPGIPSFIPAADPTDTLFGVARTNQGPVLSGWRFPYVASQAETIQRSFATMGRWVNKSAKKFVVCLSAMDWLSLSLEQDARVVKDDSAMQKWGTEGLIVRTPFGPVTVIAIPQLKDGRGYIIDWSTWTLFTLGNLPHVIDDDGKVFQRLGADDPANNNLNGDGIEMRFRIWKVLLCDMPMSNATFATA
jgi:hypothetical protein